MQRTCCRLVVLVIALALAAPPLWGGGAPAAKAACDIFVDSCTFEFQQLNADITTYVPGQYAPSMLSRVAQAQPLFPNDPIRAGALLTSVCTEVTALGPGGRVSAAGVQAITADVAVLLPPNPILPPSPIVPPNPIRCSG